MNVRSILVSVWCLILLPAAAGAQTAVSGSIAGTVRDASGGVLPGVTVEASSPALIEKVRSAVTDGNGVYRIVDLRPGTYTVTFRLPGFTTFQREGVELTTGFTATINAEMKVGAVEETISVTGESPIVDTSNVRTQAVFSRDTLDLLPVSRTSRGYVTLMLGATMDARAQDVGGSTGEDTGSISVHGNRGGDMIWGIDGMRASRATGAGGGFSVFQVNQASVQEISFQTAGISAESETGGIQMNVVPREGGNAYSGYYIANYTGSGMQTENMTSEIRSRGFAADVLKVKRIYDFAAAMGGPIKRDRLWFYTAHRAWGTTRPLPEPGNYFNKNHNTPLFYVYDPDPSRSQDGGLPRRSHNVRLTWQAAQSHKINFYYDQQPACNCPRIYAGLHTPEAMADHAYGPNHVTQVAWSAPITNRLLFEAGVARFLFGINFRENKGVDPDDIAVVDLANDFRLNARVRINTSIRAGDNYGEILDQQYNGRFAVSYVTGSHNFKTGTFWQFADSEEASRIHGDVLYTLLNGVPRDITQYSTPGGYKARAFNTGLYAQDQWTIRKLTLNLGMRFDYINGWSMEHSVPAGRWVGPRTYQRVENVPNFKDLSPRMGAAYDLFGNGKTALKGSFGRYISLIGTSLAVSNSPSRTEVTNAVRTWNDANRDFVPQESELGPSSNLRFGTLRPGTRSNEDVLTGFGNRAYNWQASAVIEHELRPGLGLNAGYYRTWYGNNSITDNLLVAPADYDEYCVTAPVNPRLPNSGQQICGLYDVKPAKFGQVDNLIRSDRDFGGLSEVYNGLEVGLTGRLPNGATIGGGMSTGQTVFDNCALAKVDSPQASRFCHYTLPFAGQAQLKLNGLYPLPWDLQVSGNFQDLPGLPITANHVLTNALIAPSLGRNLSAGARCTSTIELIEPGTMREGRRRQLDLRLARNMRFGVTRVLGTFEVFNVLNANSVLQMTTRYGAAWLRPSEILSARLFKVGVQVSF